MKDSRSEPVIRLSLVCLICLTVVWSGCSGLSSSSAGNSGSGSSRPQNLQAINHIIFMAQENRGFDHYFGAMRQYWADNSIADQSFDGLPEFNPSSGATPLRGPVATNPGCDPAFPPPSDCVHDKASPAVDSLHMISMCLENPSPSWNESHTDWNLSDPVSSKPTLDGFVHAAAHDARAQPQTFTDVDGRRAMSYYDGNNLPYYYFLASNFATSDRWFSPVMSRTQPNRMYSLAATSAGHVYPLTGPPLKNPTIFDELQAAGVSWKVYVTDLQHAKPPVQDSALNMFAAAAKYPKNIVSSSEFLTDVQNGSLPSVAYIDPGYASGLDEHPGLDDNHPGGNIQAGAQYVSTLINALMQSSSWQDSVFILTYDEGGGFYDHVAPQAAVSPDGIKPVDLQSNSTVRDICTYSTGPNCNFVFTGYRVPLMVISPFAKKNYVSHTVADYTAWLKLVETRFGVSSLTK